MSVITTIAVYMLFSADPWSAPVNLGISGVDDINPQTCRLQGDISCLVWQSYRNGNWDIFSRLVGSPTDTIRVTNSLASDINPSVANSWDINPLWCVWQNNSAGNWEIYASSFSFSGRWSAPVNISNDNSNQDTKPSVSVIDNYAWVAWQKGGTDQIFLEEHFEGSGIPAGWIVYDYNGDNYKWTVGTTADLGPYTPPNYGTKYAYYSDRAAGDGVINYAEALVSPGVRLSGVTGRLKLIYDWGFRVNQSGEKMRVRLRKKVGGSWLFWTNLVVYTTDGSGTETIDLTSELPCDSMQFMWLYSDSTAPSHWGYACACDNVILKVVTPSNIYACFHNGTSWSTPIPVINDSLYNYDPKISGPFVVWEKNQDIYYSQYTGGSWQAPQPIAAHPASDAKPDIAGGGPYAPGRWVFWQSNRDGNYEIYRTELNNFGIYYRMTYNDSSDIAPSPLYFVSFVRQGEPQVTGFCSYRNGNPDIYSLLPDFYPPYDSTVAVDVNPAQDLTPVTTLVNAWLYSYLWCFWQTNRNSNWDIYGSYMLVSTVGIGEAYRKMENLPIEVLPNPFAQKVKIKYAILDNGNKDENIAIRIYDINGRLIKDLSPLLSCPSGSVIWTGTDQSDKPVPSGVYFVTLDTGDRLLLYTHKILKTK